MKKKNGTLSRADSLHLAKIKLSGAKSTGVTRSGKKRTKKVATKKRFTRKKKLFKGRKTTIHIEACKSAGIFGKCAEKLWNEVQARSKGKFHCRINEDAKPGKGNFRVRKKIFHDWFIETSLKFLFPDFGRRSFEPNMFLIKTSLQQIEIRNICNLEISLRFVSEIIITWILSACRIAHR